jgi:hypothetical protein
MRLAAVQRNAENQQERSLQENWGQQSLSFAPNLHLNSPRQKVRWIQPIAYWHMCRSISQPSMVANGVDKEQTP